MASSLSNLVNNLSEGIYKFKCKYGYDDKTYETSGITCKVCDCFHKYTYFKSDIIECKCLCCNKNYQQVWLKKKEQFLNTYKFSDQHNNTFILLLWKDVYHYENIDNWEIFMKTSLPEKEAFYSHLCRLHGRKWICKDLI